ncbi:MAG: hypothetical protein IH586_12425 [Anaerolineaceae bacterium]|nr:hypothetical protein [Anaerolineaceae bacterium]
MNLWDEDYFNMEVQAFIRIEPNGSGDFQFGHVSGVLDGEAVKTGNLERFEFTWVIVLRSSRFGRMHL